MLDSVLQIVLLPLFLTLIVEFGVWKSINLLFRKYDLPYIMLSITAVNLATNPAFNVLSSMFDPARAYYIIEILSEVLIIFIEALIFYTIYRKDFRRFVLLSAAMNLVSYSIGLLLFKPAWI
jgi:hypothetical protein